MDITAGGFRPREDFGFEERYRFGSDKQKQPEAA